MAGSANAAMGYITVMQQGVVTGGDFNGTFDSGCKDYALSPCTHISGEETDEYVTSAVIRWALYIGRYALGVMRWASQHTELVRTTPPMRIRH